jgi:hypothetical protein
MLMCQQPGKADRLLIVWEINFKIIFNYEHAEEMENKK